MVNGIDTSAYQQDTNWNTVREAGYSFCYIKATEGTDFISDQYAPDFSNAKDAGMLRGAYHYFHFGTDPIDQAKFFLTRYHPTAGDLPPMLDLEDSTTLEPAQCVEAISKFLAVVEAATRVRCALYMGFYYWEGTLGATDGFSGHPLWLAQYSDQEQPSMVPHVWDKWTFWQYSGFANVPGVNGTCDVDKFYGDLDQLRALCIPGG
jgi:lysozyme